MHLIKKVAVVVGIAVAGAVVAGVIVGVAARLFMRLVTLAAGHDAAFSWSGSFFIVLIYVLSMLPGAVAAAVTPRWWRWLAAGAGSIFLCLPAIGVAEEEIGNTAGLSALQWVGLTAAGVATFATIVAAPIMTLWLVDAMRGRKQRSRVALAA